MTIALKIGNEESQVRGFIYLDAVVSYTKTLGGKVTSFPVDSGVQISDHFIKVIFPYKHSENVSDVTKDVTNKNPNGSSQIDDDSNAEDTILKLMEDDSKITISLISNHLGIGPRQVKRIIKKLSEDNKVTHIGAARNGSWKVNH